MDATTRPGPLPQGATAANWNTDPGPEHRHVRGPGLPGEPVLVRGDEHRLHQVLANLMSNAAKHTPAGTVVTVALAAGQGPAPSS